MSTMRYTARNLGETAVGEDLTWSDVVALAQQGRITRQTLLLRDDGKVFTDFGRDVVVMDKEGRPLTTVRA